MQLINDGEPAARHGVSVPRNLYKMIARLTPRQRGDRRRKLTERANWAEAKHGEDSKQATRAMGRLGAFSAITASMEVR